MNYFYKILREKYHEILKEQKKLIIIENKYNDLFRIKRN